MAMDKPSYYYKDGFIFKKPNEAANNEILTVNYLISTNCQLDCIYCIAKDVMEEYAMPTREIVDETIDRILEINPLVVVLTGGEPLLSPHLKHVVKRFYNKVNIIVDTNGLLITECDLEFYKAHDVLFRISMDLPDNEINEKTRISPHKTSMKGLMDGFELLDDLGISYVVSTVISNFNELQLEFMLPAIFWKCISSSLKGWRLLDMQPCHGIDISKYAGCPITKFPKTFDATKLYLKYALDILRKDTNNPEALILQTSNNADEHSTILVMPDGTITISNGSDATREVVEMAELKRVLNNRAHQNRYLSK